MKSRDFSKQIKKNIRFLTKSFRSGNTGSEAQQWLLDNFHLIYSKGLDSAAFFSKSHGKESVSVPESLENACRAAVKAGKSVGSRLILGLKSANTTFDTPALEAVGNLLVYFAVNDCALAVKNNDEKLISSAVLSLHQLADIDYDRICSDYSVSEQFLKKDPSGDYENMTPETKAAYRKRCSVLARKEKISEAEFAEKMLNYSSNAAVERQKHIGWWLFENREYKKAAKYKGYAFLYCRIFIPMIASTLIARLSGYWWLGTFTYLPLHETFRPIIERLFAIGTKPFFLPRTEISGHVPDNAKTVVAVAGLVPPPKDAEKCIKHLKELYEANPDRNITYCLLADLTEGKYPKMQEDDTAIDILKREFMKLCNNCKGNFSLVIRKRVKVSTQNAYSGWERKRGAITELIRYMKTGKENFLVFCGDRRFFSQTGYLIILDSDTYLPFKTVPGLISAAIHPLNRPEIDRNKNIVTAGFGILAPRISTDAESAGKTLFSRITNGFGGITAYNGPVGNHYQDLMGVSIFSGKGLIDVDAYYKCLDTSIPAERVLSHDILEGAYLRCGLCSDVELTDSCPSNAAGWNKRLSRWIRGDFQNVLWLLPYFIVDGKRRENPILGINKIFLSDNIARESSPIICLLLLLISAFVNDISWFLFILAISGTCFATVFSGISTIFSGGIYRLTRRYYSKFMPEAQNCFVRALFDVTTLVNSAVTAVSGAATGLYRQFISKKRLLDWTTSAQTEKLSSKKGSFAACVAQSIVSVILGLLMVIFLKIPYKVIGILFILCPCVLWFTGKTTLKKRPLIARPTREKLMYDASLMWKFYETYCNKEENYLPPDNVQMSPVFSIAHRTSPTNIGLMLLSAVCACDMGIIDAQSMISHIENTLDTVGKLEKYSGNLLNWYDTKTLEPLEPKYCSAVDSGNFVCCLEALKNGLKEYSSCPDSARIIGKIEKLENGTNLAIFYNNRRKLLHIGFDLSEKKYTPSYYDLLMSEARMTSYFAVASGQIPKEHWSAIGRTLTAYNGYSGPVSWTGTMFEYYMPALLLPTEENTMAYEALGFCVYCQQARANRYKRPWGCSESGFYSFDNQLNYQYKAHGIQRLGLKRRLNDEYVVSPYSSYLALPFYPEKTLKNLQKLSEYPVNGKFGMYEALDFTRQNGDGNPSVVRSYMAHHVGMSICAVENALFDRILCRRFMSGKLGGAKILLNEKIPNGTPIRKRYIEPEIPEKEGRQLSDTESYESVSPFEPHMAVYSNGEMNLILSDSGNCECTYRDYQIYRSSTDYFADPQGVFAAVFADGIKYSLTAAPDYAPFHNVRAEFSPNFGAFYSSAGVTECGMSVSLHRSLPCEIRSFRIKNHSPRKCACNLLIYFEPCMTRRDDFLSHPAFSRLFIESRYDSELNVLIFKKRVRANEMPMTIVAGFSGSVNYSFSCSREEVLKRPYSTRSLLMHPVLINNADGMPDNCCAVSAEIKLSAKSQKEVQFIISAAAEEDEAIRNFLECSSQENKPQNGAASPLLTGGIEGRLGTRLLPYVMQKKSKEKPAEINSASLLNLWECGISGDNPIIVFRADNSYDCERLYNYFNLQKLLRTLKIEFDFCVLFTPHADFTPDSIIAVAEKAGLQDMLGIKGGVFIFDTSAAAARTLEAIETLSAYTVPPSLNPEKTSDAGEYYTQIKILPTHPAANKNTEKLLTVQDGFFTNNSFTFTRSPELPHCHILANRNFGTMVSDMALGYTFALNARENRLTPWENDSRADNRGEMLIFRSGNEFFDAINGSRAEFFDDKAVYYGESGGISYAVTVKIDPQMSIKRISVNMISDKDTTVEAAYFIRPCMFFDRRHSNAIQAEIFDGNIVMRNPYNTACGGYTALGSGFKKPQFCLDTGDFFNGRWNSRKNDSGGLCAAVSGRFILRAGKNAEINFSLSYAKTKEEAAVLSKLEEINPQVNRENKITVSTPDKAIDAMFNLWLPHQFESARINARTGFYQSSGAYGFRDQLQDHCANLLLNPERTREHILLACSRQFIEGDVLHWWHELKNGPSGVRTRCSDDKLWLPYTVAEYVEKTGDTEILNTEAPFLYADKLQENENERYFSPSVSETSASVYEHCLRSFDNVLFGNRGLPLIGTCDWNDGFSNIGIKGIGESVWLAQFYIITATKFAKICEIKNDPERSEQLIKKADELRNIIDEKCFENDRYLRAFFDDGTPVGSENSREDKIDSLTQAFAVMSKMPDKERVNKALDTALSRLVDYENGVIRLFEPAFDKVNAGYISSYPPGIRENSGQYTHAAIWLAKALYEAGRSDEGYALLEIINPAARCSNQLYAKKYKTEPYSVAADIYYAENLKGRGGWSHYTGAAAWLYRVILENLLGININGDIITVNPSIPKDWNGFSAKLCYRKTEIKLTVERDRTKTDTIPMSIPLDGKKYDVKLVIGNSNPIA